MTLCCKSTVMFIFTVTRDFTIACDQLRSRNSVYLNRITEPRYLRQRSSISLMFDILSFLTKNSASPIFRLGRSILLSVSRDAKRPYRTWLFFYVMGLRVFSRKYATKLAVSVGLSVGRRMLFRRFCITAVMPFARKQIGLCYLSYPIASSLLSSSFFWGTISPAVIGKLSFVYNEQYIIIHQVMSLTTVPSFLY